VIEEGEEVEVIGIKGLKIKVKKSSKRIYRKGPNMPLRFLFLLLL